MGSGMGSGKVDQMDTPLKILRLFRLKVLFEADIILG